MSPCGTATAVKFTVELDAGPQSLQTWFTEAGGKSRGAFYVEVRRMNDVTQSLNLEFLHELTK